MDDLILNTIGTWVLSFFQINPAFASLLLFLGAARLCIKPAMTILQALVKLTPYDSDDKWLSDLEVSRGYKLFVYLLDWVLSVKVPEKKD